MTSSSSSVTPAASRLGDRALRFPRPAGVSAAAIVHTARSWPGVVDVVVAAADVAIYFDSAASVALSPAQLAALSAAPTDSVAPREITLHAIYDGADLEAVALALSRSVAEVISLHAAALYTVDMLGFAPGFAYLTGLPPSLVLPRRPTPRPRVPAGSIAIAAHYTAVYPFDSPGGWHLLGRLSPPRSMFGASGSLLQPGDRVRFAR